MNTVFGHQNTMPATPETMDSPPAYYIQWTKSPLDCPRSSWSKIHNVLQGKQKSANH